MATISKEQNERLAVAVNDISTMKDDIKEIKENQQAQSEKFDKFIDSLDRRFVTRNELKITQWVFGFIVAGIALWLNLTDHLK